VWGDPHDPFQVVASPMPSTATHDDADAHETAFICSVVIVLTVHLVPFQVDSDSENATAQKLVVGHETVPGAGVKVGAPVGVWVVQVVPLKTSTLPVVRTAVHEVCDVHVTPTAWSPAGAVVGPHVVPLYDSKDPVEVAATQNVESGHDTATGPPVPVIFVLPLHELPFHLKAFPELSTNMQNEDVGHEATDNP
jgi:hypothetical protein